MSKISENGDPLASLREHYAARERESETRHRDEVREIKETQKTEIDEVRIDAHMQVQDLQAENNMKLNQRDLQYQKEIEAVKSLYSKRVAEGKKPE